MLEWLHMLFFFFINLDRFFLTQGVGVDSGDEEELVFVLCFINSRWFHDVFVFQPDKTHLSNQIQSLNFFEEFLYLFFFILFPLFACALAFLYISDIDSIQLFYVGWGKGGYLSNIWQPLWHNGKEELGIVSTNRKLRFHLSILFYFKIIHFMSYKKIYHYLLWKLSIHNIYKIIASLLFAIEHWK